MIFKNIQWAFLILFLLLSFQARAIDDADLEKFCEKYDIAQEQLARFEKRYLDSDMGLKDLTGLHAQLGDFTSKEIATKDLIDFAVHFSKRLDWLAEVKLNEAGRLFGWTQKDYDKAVDEALDSLNGRDSKEFLKSLAQSLIRSARPPKPTREKALSLAKAVQIRMDMRMMRPQLKDEEAMRSLLGEKAFERIPIERSGRPGSVL